MKWNKIKIKEQEKNKIKMLRNHILCGFGSLTINKKQMDIFERSAYMQHTFKFTQTQYAHKYLINIIYILIEIGICGLNLALAILSLKCNASNEQPIGFIPTPTNAFKYRMLKMDPFPIFALFANSTIYISICTLPASYRINMSHIRVIMHSFAILAFSHGHSMRQLTCFFVVVFCFFLIFWQKW